MRVPSECSYLHGTSITATADLSCCSDQEGISSRKPQLKLRIRISVGWRPRRGVDHLTFMSSRGEHIHLRVDPRNSYCSTFTSTLRPDYSTPCIPKSPEQYILHPMVSFQQPARMSTPRWEQGVMYLTGSSGARPCCRDCSRGAGRAAAVLCVCRVSQRVFIISAVGENDSGVMRHSPPTHPRLNNTKKTN